MSKHYLRRPHVAPAVREVTIGTSRYVAVALMGKYGRGLEMLLDAPVWERVRQITPNWLVIKAKRGRPAFVGSQCRTRVAPMPVSAAIDLARIIARAPKGHGVYQKNGHILDLRRANLAVVAPRSTLTLPAFTTTTETEG